MSGCASPPGAAPGWITGRLALRIDASSGQPAQSLTVAFELRGDGDEGELRLLSPLGTQLALARWAPGRVRLVTSDGERSFESLESLAQGALGEALPLAALPAWLAGQPWPGAQHRAHAAGFDQLGWRIETTGRADGLILASRAEPRGVTLRVRLDNAAPS